MDSLSILADLSISVPILTRNLGVLAPARSPQSFSFGSGYSYGANGSGNTKADQLIFLAEDVTYGTPRAINIYNGSEKNPLDFDVTALVKTVKTWVLVCMPTLTNGTTAGLPLEFAFGSSIGTAFGFGGAITFTMEPGEVRFCDKPSGVAVASGGANATLTVSKTSGTGTKGQFVLFCSGFKT